MYVVSVEITDMIDCCPRDSGMISVTVSTSQTSFYPTCTGSLHYGRTQDYKVHCFPPASGSYVTITLIGNNVTLVLCQVVIRTIGKLHCRVLTSRQTSANAAYIYGEKKLR